MESTVVDCHACNQCDFNGDGCNGGTKECKHCGEKARLCCLDDKGLCDWCSEGV